MARKIQQSKIKHENNKQNSNNNYLTSMATINLAFKDQAPKYQVEEFKLQGHKKIIQK